MPDTPDRPVAELRVALTTSDYDRLVRFYRLGLGIDPAESWTEDGARGLLLELGRGSLEIFDEGYAAHVDRIETGERVSGAIRLALRVPDLDAALARLVAHGASVVHPPVTTPWGDRNVRLRDPDGLQLTVFEPREAGDG